MASSIFFVLLFQLAILSFCRSFFTLLSHVYFSSKSISLNFNKEKLISALSYLNSTQYVYVCVLNAEYGSSYGVGRAARR